MWFKCKHPANSLHVRRDMTEEKTCDIYSSVTYNLYCRKCGEDVPISYARNDIGFDAALEVTRKAMAKENNQ